MMKKSKHMKRILCFFAFSLSLCLHSCDQSSSGEPIIDHESAGLTHNAALRYLTSKTDVSKASNEEYYKFIVEYTLKNSKRDKAKLEKMLMSFEHKDYAAYKGDFSIWLDESKNFLNEVEHSYMSRMLGFFSTVSKHPQFNLVEETRRLQLELEADPRPLRKQMITSALSIGKHSFEYWKIAQEGVNHPFNFVFHQKGIWDGVWIAAVDMIAYSDAMAATEGRDETAALNESAYQSARFAESLR